MSVYGGLHWNWGPYDLPSEGGFNVGNLLSAAEGILGELGYSGLENGGSQWWVCGSKGPSAMVVIYISMGGYAFTQVVVASAAGESPEEQKIAAEEVAAFETKMKGIGWL